MKVKILRHETDHSLPSRVKVKNVWSYILLLFVLLWYAQGLHLPDLKKYVAMFCNICSQPGLMWNALK
jgi:hypothetical protein